MRKHQDMKENDPTRKHSNDYLFYDMLVRIFIHLNVADLVAASFVCKTWNLASRAPELWKKLDLTTLNYNNYFNIPMLVNSWKDENSSSKMTRFLKYVTYLSGGNISIIIFNFYVYLTDEHLLALAERTPNLKRLVLPLTGSISKIGIETAMKSWGALESMTITSIFKDHHYFIAIGKYCPNIVRLKFTCTFEQEEAEAVVKNVPNLKELSIRFIIVNLQALCLVLNSLKDLEVVNISHSVIVDKLDGEIEVYSLRNLKNHLDASYYRKLIVCETGECLRCQNGRNNDPRRLPHGPLEDIWRQDEITSLAH